MNSWTTLQSQLKQQKAIDTLWSNSMVTWNYIKLHLSEVILSVGNDSQTATLNEETGKVVIYATTTIPHLSYLPINIPLLHVGEPPCGDRQTRGHVKTNQTVI